MQEHSLLSVVDLVTCLQLSDIFPLLSFSQKEQGESREKGDSL